MKYLSNYHTPAVIEGKDGVRRRTRDPVTKIRSRLAKWVDIPAQAKDYSLHFDKIDQGNGQEEKTKIMMKSRLHNWTPKLSLRFYNFNENNAYK